MHAATAAAATAGRQIRQLFRDMRTDTPAKRVIVPAPSQAAAGRAARASRQRSCKGPTNNRPSADAGAPSFVLFPSMTLLRSTAVRVALLILAAGAGCSTGEPPWAARNQRVIDEHTVAGRTRELPPVTVPLALVAGTPVERSALPSITIAPG